MVRTWKPHSRIKLRFIKQYLQICADHHKKNDFSHFTFVDLFCGEPLITFKDGKIENGSPLIALNKNIKCIFNDISTEVIENLIKLKKKFPNKIIKVFNFDANEGLDEILKEVTSYYHSLFYLDPYNASQLSFKTIKCVIDHIYIYKKTRVIRRPELLINFPINSIVRNCGFIYDKENQSISDINNNFYGNDNWKRAYLSGKTAKERRQNLLNVYIDNFKNYYLHSYYVLVESIDSKSPQYYIIFFSNYSKIDHILPNLIDNINKWKKQDFIRKYKYKISYPIDYYNRKESTKVIEYETSKNIEELG